MFAAYDLLKATGRESVSTWRFKEGDEVEMMVRELLRMCFRLFLSPKIFKISIQSLNISHPCKLIVTQSRWSACFNSPTPLGSLYLPQHSVTLSPGLKEDPSLRLFLKTTK